MQLDIDTASAANLPAPDRLAISHTLKQLQAGFMARDAAALNEVYSEDADWVNAFGSRKRGRAQIVDYLKGLFADGNFNAGQLEGPPQITLRVLTEDVVLVAGHLRIRGQGLLDGGAIDLRDNHSIRVLQRQADGRWPIVSEMYMDANREQSYVGHA